jgi:GABA permease
VKRRVLLVVGSEVNADEVKRTTTELGADTEVRVVAPATRISRVDWLTNAEDDARDDAVERADQAANAVPTDDVDASAGDADPLLAISDAVRTFQPDEIVIVSKPDQDASWLETGTAESARIRFSVPVRHVVVP